MHVNRRTISYISLSFIFALIMSAGLLQLSQSTAQSAALRQEVPPAGTLIITKTVNGGAADSPWQFNIQGGEIISNVEIPGAGGVLTVALPSGSYTLTEAVKDGYYVSQSQCYFGQIIDSAVNGIASRTLYPSLGDAGDACLFVNNKYAQVTVVKDAIPDSDQPFQFAISQGYEITPTMFTLVDDGTGVSNTKTFTGLHSSLTQIGEQLPINWTQGGVLCEDSNGPVEPPLIELSAAIEQPKLPLYSYPLLPEPGEAYTCTFTNLGAQLTMTKTVTTDPETCAPVTMDSCVFPGTEVYYCYAAENTGAVTFTRHSLVDNVFGPLLEDYSYDLAPGEKVNTIDAGLVVTATPAVTVTNIATWTAEYTFTPPVNMAFREQVIRPSAPIDEVQLIYFMTGTVTVSDTATVNVCDPSRIVVDKATLPAGSDQSFDFAFGKVTEPPTPAIPFSVTESLSYTTPDLKPGIYAVTEQTLPDGWGASGTPVCTDDAGAPYDAGAIDLPPGVTVTCVFTNERLARIYVDKVTTPAASPVEFDFTLTNGGDVNEQFSLTDEDSPWASPWLYRGAYSISEAPITSWTLVEATCDNGDTVDDVFVDYGEEVTCTFSNRFDDPTALEDGQFPSMVPQLFLPQMEAGD